AREQFAGWVAYIPKAIEQSIQQLAAREQRLQQIVSFFIASAYANGVDVLRVLDESGRLRGFLKALKSALDEANQTRGFRTNASFLAKAVSRSIAHLGDNFDELPLETIQKKVADSRVLVAMAVAYDMGNGSDELLKALTRFPCVPSRCHLGGL